MTAASAQWEEDFSDGDFSQQPVWQGDTNDFIVSPAGQLQLMAPDAGNSALFSPVLMPDLNGMEWSFHIRLDFAPSSANYCRVYLATDQPDADGNGYFVQFGEALSNDAVELFRQDGTVLTPVCRATDGAIASAFEIGVKVVRDRDAVWSLYVDTLGGDRYQLEAIGAEGYYAAASWMGVGCTYTTSNTDAFHFDDFYAGPIRTDTARPPDPLPGEVVLSELYFEPDDAADIPAEEFIELFHRGQTTIELDGWRITDGTTQGVFPPHTVMEPGSFLLLTAISDTQMYSPYGKTIGIPSFPSLNNDIGDRLTLIDRSGMTIDAVTFSDATYADPEKENGGWTIEKIDLDFTCEAGSNWKASVDSEGGTPGRENSVNDLYTDRIPPRIDYAWMPDSDRVSVVFTEYIDTSDCPASDAVSLERSDGSEITFYATWQTKNQLELFIDKSDYEGGLRVVATHSVTDCPGNAADTSVFCQTAIPGSPESGDVVVNELLFEGAVGVPDFVEIINRSSKVIDMSELYISETTKDSYPDVTMGEALSSAHRLLFPGEIAALSISANTICASYPVSDPTRIFSCAAVPDFNIESGGVLITDRGGHKVDWFPYDQTMHFPLLSETKGISLERISSAGLSESTSTWHSAASSVGYATPGSPNSQATDWIGSESEVAVTPTVFSPDNDGEADVMLLNYRFHEPGNLSTILIFTESGGLVKSLMEGELIGTEGYIPWDGTDDSGTLVPEGRYVVMMSTRGLSGSDKKFKLGCGVVYR
ncbi:MAG: hypothetical protein RL021_1807 [Bacteroidota bacterium]